MRLVIMGLHSAKSLVLGFTLVRNLREKGFKHLDYWRRSIYAATAARMLASRVGVIQEEEAFLAGLLADVGTLVLHQALGEEYDRLASEAPNHQALVQIERQRLELDHAFAAGILAEQWKLPPLLALPIAQHHELEGTTDRKWCGRSCKLCMSAVDARMCLSKPRRRNRSRRCASSARIISTWTPPRAMR